MTSRLRPIAIALAVLALPAPALAADPPAPKPSAQSSPAGKPAKHRPESPKTEDAGTLDAISIEGEVDVPQVLFITASERPRFHDRRYRDYLPGRKEAVRKTVLPSRLTVHFRP